MREFVNKNTIPPQIQYRLYFGYLIPRYKKVMPLDVSHIRLIAFKHGLMLLYQFIDFVHRIHLKGRNFGYLDFTNMFFI